MPSRNELNVRARMANVVAANYPNDSKLEQAVLYAEKTAAAAAGTATVLAVSNATTKDDVAGVAGSANV